MKQTEGFYTMKGYQRNGEEELTSAMEDYLEMITRLDGRGKTVKVNDLAKMLHVKPSSVTKMVQQLNQTGYLEAEKYGDIFLTGKGREKGNYLLYRHEVIHRFLCVLNQSEEELEQAEKIEHFLNSHTVENLDILTDLLEKEWRKSGRED